MEQVREVNKKVLIGVAKRLESMRNTYRRFHQYEIPVGNPIEKDIKKLLKVLHRFSTAKNINLSNLENVSEIVTNKRSSESQNKKIYEI